MSNGVFGASPWTSIYLFLSEPLEPFLTDHLTPALADELGARRVRRFFFIRYAEGGLHLRLRFRLRPAVEPEEVLAILERHAREFLIRRGDSGPVRLERHPYDREAFYFGQTAATVYSELLNEATSWLALRLLTAPGAGQWERRWLGAAGTLGLLQRLSARDEAGYRASLDESLTFARRAAAELGFKALPAGVGEEDGVDAAVRGACRTAAGALARDPTVHRIARLLRRLRNRPFGAAGAAHALHLYCNKLGFSLGDEQMIFGSLRRLGTW